MGSSEWEELLERKLAFLPGSRDPGGGPVLEVPLPSDPTLHDLGGISATLKYLKTIPSASCRDRGFVVLVDARTCPYRLVKPTVSTIRAALGNIRYLFVVRPDAFWEKQRVDCRKSEVDSQPIYISASKLFRYLEIPQLREDYGGTLKYDHFSWIKTRKMYEEFIDECERVKRDLESLQTELRREEPCSRASTLQDLLCVNTSTYHNITTRPSVVFKMGEEVLQILEMDEESGFKMHEALGFADEACRRVRSLLQEVRLLLTAVQSSWKRLQSALDMYHEVQGLESEMTEIGKWLVSAGQTLLTEARIGVSTADAESLLREHEAIELKCRETYARWARLRYRVDEAAERGEGELRTLAEHESKTSDLRALKEYTDTLVRSFASRLDRRRTLILASVRFHRIVHQLEHRCTVLLEEKRWIANNQNLDLLKKIIRELTARKETIDYLGSEGTKSGEKLLDLLTVGVKDLSGRDVTPDYTKELNHVHKLLKRLHELYERTSRQAEVARLRLQQAGQLMTCHQDLKQAQEWLQALLQALVTSHSHVGRSINEIRHLKTEHQMFQETAAGTFEYGYECARAALLVEKSGGSPTPSDSNKLIAELENTWRMFIQGSQEQLTRLRVAGIFFRTMEQHLCRLDAFIASVVTRTKTRGWRFAADQEGRNLLATRDRLLREIGRNVRLGKLLKERMSESLVPYFKGECFNENLVTQEAISERIHFISRRARQLDALMLPSAVHQLQPESQPQHQQPQQQKQNQPIPPTSSPPSSPLPPPPSSSPLLPSHSDSPLPPPPTSSPPLSPSPSNESVHSPVSPFSESPKQRASPVPLEEYEKAPSSEYWTCSECSCCGSFHTCDDLQDVTSVFARTHDGSQSFLDDDSLYLDDLLCPLEGGRRHRVRSRSLSPSRRRILGRVRCRSKSLSRSRDRGHQRKSRSSSSGGSLNRTLVSEDEDKVLEDPFRDPKVRTEGIKRPGPPIHPDAEARRRRLSRSRSTSLTREIVTSFLNFRDEVLSDRSRSRSRSKSRERNEENKKLDPYYEVVHFDHILSSDSGGRSSVGKESSRERELIGQGEEGTPDISTRTSLGELVEGVKPVVEESNIGEEIRSGTWEMSGATDLAEGSDPYGGEAQPINIPVQILTETKKPPGLEDDPKSKETFSERKTTKVILHADSGGDQKTLTLEEITTRKQPEERGADKDREVLSLKPISCSASATSPFSVPTPTTTITPLLATTTIPSTTCSVVGDSTDYVKLGTDPLDISKSVAKASDFMAAKTIATSLSQRILQLALVSSASKLLNRPNITEIVEKMSTFQMSSPISYPHLTSTNGKGTRIDCFQEPLTTIDEDAVDREKLLSVLDNKETLSEDVIDDDKIESDNVDRQINYDGVNIFDGDKVKIDFRLDCTGHNNTILNQNKGLRRDGQSLETKKLQGTYNVESSKGQIQVDDFFKAEETVAEIKFEKYQATTLLGVNKIPEGEEGVKEDVKFGGAISSEDLEDEYFLPPRPPLPDGALMRLTSIYARISAEVSPRPHLPSCLLAQEEEEALSPFPPRPEPPLSDSEDTNEQVEDEDEPLFPTFVRVSSPEEYSYIGTSPLEEQEIEDSSLHDEYLPESSFTRRPLSTILEISSSSPSPEESPKTSREASPEERRHLSAQLLQLLGSYSQKELCSSSTNPVENLKVEVSTPTSFLSPTCPNLFSPSCHSTLSSAKEFLNSNNPPLPTMASNADNESVLDRPLVDPSVPTNQEDMGQRQRTHQRSVSPECPVPSDLRPERSGLRDAESEQREATSHGRSLLDLLQRVS